jgi:hypothetical protein
VFIRSKSFLIESLDLLNIRSYGLQRETIWFLPFLFVSLLLLFLAILLWLRIEALDWVRVERMDTLISFLSLRKGFQFTPTQYNVGYKYVTYYTVFIMLRSDPSASSLFRTFIMKGCWILSKLVPPQLKQSCDFCPWFYLYGGLHLLICVCWIIFVSLGWNQFNHSVWSF